MPILPKRNKESGGIVPPFFPPTDGSAIPVLDARLALAASFVRPGCAVCDVGTDHAYLPIYLIQSGVSPYAVVTDINPAPLARAQDNALRYNCRDRLSFCLTDGIPGEVLEARNVRDILICGMGGELIARILAEAPYTRSAGIRSILQPMSSAADLRLYLAQAGYCVEDERLASAAGRLYTCMSVVWDGVSRSLSAAEAVLGCVNIQRGLSGAELFGAYLRREYVSACKRYAGRRAGGLPSDAEKTLLDELRSIAEREGIAL